MRCWSRVRLENILWFKVFILDEKGSWRRVPPRPVLDEVVGQFEEI